MNYGFTHIHCEGTRDKTEIPPWAPQVQRWSQLDDASFNLACATYENREQLKNIELAVFVSPSGSNLTDANFVSHSRPSAKFFVHTLPNVRALYFAQLAQFEGEILCLSSGNLSLNKALVQFYPIIPTKKQILIVSTHFYGNKHYSDFYRLSVENEGPRYISIKNTNHMKMDNFQIRRALEDGIDFSPNDRIYIGKNG